MKLKPVAFPLSIHNSSPWSMSIYLQWLFKVMTVIKEWWLHVLGVPAIPALLPSHDCDKCNGNQFALTSSCSLYDLEIIICNLRCWLPQKLMRKGPGKVTSHWGKSPREMECAYERGGGVMNYSEVALSQKGRGTFCGKVGGSWDNTAQRWIRERGNGLG